MMLGKSILKREYLDAANEANLTLNLCKPLVTQVILGIVYHFHFAVAFGWCSHYKKDIDKNLA